MDAKRARIADLQDAQDHPPVVSFIMPMRNAEAFLAETLASVVAQTYTGAMELCVYDDGSTDASSSILEEWRPALEGRDVQLVVCTSQPDAPAGGCGKGRNLAVAASRGDFLCFLDADDVMAVRRVEVQLGLAQRHSRAIVGARIWRDGDATPRYTTWLNGMTQEQLHHQQLREVTLCQPTWFMARATFERVGGYVEDHPNQAEDMIFLYRHLQLGGHLVRSDEPLLMYRFHTGSVTGQRAVGKEVKRLEELLNTPPWMSGFTIWNAGREGRRLYRSLSEGARRRVRALCDVDAKKLAQREWHAHPLDVRVPIVHFRHATPPLLLCVKGGLTGGEFERNVASLGLVEGEQYLHFS